MDLKQKLQKAAVQVFTKFASVTERVTYNQVKTEFAPNSNKAISSSKKNTVNAIFLAINKEQHAVVEMVTGDMIVLLAGATTKFVPELNDTIVRGKDTYTVVGIANDSVGAVIKLQVRL